MSKQLLGLYNLFVEVFDYNATSDVVTPLELAREMVRGLPTDGTMLVPGSGIGTFAVAAVLEGRDPCTITCVEYNKAYSAIGARILERFGIKCIHADFLTQGPDMKFDVIIGNPPYQDDSNAAKNNKLWIKFIHKSLGLLQDNGFLVFVTPRSFVGRTQQPAKIRDLLSKEYSLLKVNLDANSHFKIGVDICHWLVQKVPYQGVTEVTENKSTQNINLLNDLPLPEHKKVSDAIAEKIYEVVKKDSTPKLDAKLNSDELPNDVDGIHKVYTSGRNKYFTSNSTTDNHGKWKLAFSYSATYKGWFVTKSDVVGSNRVIYVDSAEEGIEIGNTLLHPVITFYLDNWRKTAGYTPAIKNQGCLPDVRNMSDKQLQELFQLTEAECSYIARSHVPYKAMERVLDV